jgi:hypothetical protein
MEPACHRVLAGRWTSTCTYDRRRRTRPDHGAWCIGRAYGLRPRGSPAGWLYIVRDTEHASNGILAMAVPDIEEATSELRVAHHAQVSVVVASVRDMAGVVSCSIVIDHRRPDANWADLAGLRDAPEAHGLISVREDAWPQVTGSAEMRAVVSVEADNPDSVRWYAHEVLRLREDHPAWHDMERQLGKVGDRPGPGG